MRICLVSDSEVTVTLTLTHSHTHILTVPCTCCHDMINGIQDLKIYCHADSLILSQCCVHMACVTQPVSCKAAASDISHQSVIFISDLGSYRGLRFARPVPDITKHWSQGLILAHRQTPPLSIESVLMDRYYSSGPMFGHDRNGTVLRDYLEQLCA